MIFKRLLLVRSRGNVLGFSILAFSVIMISVYHFHTLFLVKTEWFVLQSLALSIAQVLDGSNMKTRTLVIAYPLFSTHPLPTASSSTNKYLIGMLANIESAASLAPYAEIWIYHDDSIGDEWLRLLNIAVKHSLLPISLKSFHYPRFRLPEDNGHIGLFGTLARYEALAEFSKKFSEKKDAVLAIRDADIVLNDFDLRQIQSFMEKSDKTLHRYVDGLHYPWPIIGGSFAVKPGFLKQLNYTTASWSKRIATFAEKEIHQSVFEPFCYFVDQRFLKEIFKELTDMHGLGNVESKTIHIPIFGENLQKRGQHYRVWFSDIGDVTPQFDSVKHTSLEKFICEHSEAMHEWIQSEEKSSLKNRNIKRKLLNDENKPISIKNSESSFFSNKHLRTSKVVVESPQPTRWGKHQK